MSINSSNDFPNYNKTHDHGSRRRSILIYSLVAITLVGVVAGLTTLGFASAQTNTSSTTTSANSTTSSANSSSTNTQASYNCPNMQPGSGGTSSSSTATSA